MSVIDEIAAERARQIGAEGFDAKHDDMATRHQLSLAAMSYVMAASSAQGDIADQLPPPYTWPWDAYWWKPKGRRRNLVMACALIVADIERMDRREAKRGDEQGTE